MSSIDSNEREAAVHATQYLFGKPCTPAAPLEGVVELPPDGAKAESQAGSSGEVIDVEYEVLRESPRGMRGVTPTLRPATARPNLNRRVRSPLPAEPKAVQSGLAIVRGQPARDLVQGAGDGHGQTPAPRHRKRLILKWLHGLEFADCLDASAQTPGLLDGIYHQKRTSGVRLVGFGCFPPGGTPPPAPTPSELPDVPRAPDFEWAPLDPMRQRWPGGRMFDLIVCAESLAMADQWRPALANLISMTRRYLLITTPGGPLRTADQVAGHRRHFDGLELAGAIVGHGLTLLRQRRWGFPIDSLMRSTLDNLPERSLADSIAAHPESLPMRLVSKGIYLALFSNDLFHGGSQHMLLAERKSAAI